MGTLAVDVHSHFVLRELAQVDPGFGFVQDAIWGELLTFKDRALGPMPSQLTELDLVLEDMDRRAIDVRALATASWLMCYWAEPQLAQALARAGNELMARQVSRNPGRLVGLAAVPLQDVGLAIEELEYAVTRLGLRGVAVGTNVNGRYFDDPLFDPFLAAVERLGAPIFFHPDEVAGSDRLHDHYLIRLLGNPHEAAISLARLILGGALERHPRLKPCFPMAGGSMPLLLGRVQHGWEVRPEARAMTSIAPREQLARCYFDSIVHSPEGLAFVSKTLPAGNLMLGSDYPWDMGEADPVAAVNGLRGLTPAESTAILGGTASRLLGIEAAAPSGAMCG